MMEHVMGMWMWVPRVHVRVDLMDVRVSCSTLGSQAVVPGVRESRRRSEAVAAPDASVCRVEGGVGREVGMRGWDTWAALGWVTAAP